MRAGLLSELHEPLPLGFGTRLQFMDCSRRSSFPLRLPCPTFALGPGFACIWLSGGVPASHRMCQRLCLCPQVCLDGDTSLSSSGNHKKLIPITR